MLKTLKFITHKIRKKKRLLLLGDRHSQDIAQVISHNRLSDREIFFINKRLVKVETSLKTLFGNDIKNVPKIAICSSGGSFRAMYSMSGLLEGLDSIGLLNTTLYLSTASGSSWMLVSWLASGKSLKAFNKQLRRGNKGLWIPSLDTTKALSKILRRKIFYKQDFSSIDIYGTLLSDKLLNGRKRFKQNVSDLRVNPSTPFPIFSAAFRGNKHYQPLEINPYETGCNYLGGNIPTWSIGRSFNMGHSNNIVPEMSLGLLMGMLGSSFSASINDALENIPMNENAGIYKIYKTVLDITQNAPGINKKFSPAKVPNYSLGLNSSKLADKKNLEIVDGGYLCNIPILPLLKPERDIDIIIMLDNKQEKRVVAQNLKSAERLAMREGFKLPKIDYEKVKKEQVSIFEGCRKEKVPTLIYIPLRKNDSYSKEFDPTNAKFCSTFNFNYSPKQVKLLSSLIKFTIIENKKLLLKTIKDYCYEKK